MSQPPLMVTPIADAHDVLVGDTACRRCGYNLRGLAVAGLCPECGTPVGLSAQGDFLRYSDPRWTGKLVLGLWLMAFGAGVSIASRFAMYIVMTHFEIMAVQGMFWAARLLSIVGAWLVTSPDPAGLNDAQYITARKLIRAALIINLADGLLSLGTPADALPAWRMAMTVISILVGVIGLIGECLKFGYLARLASMIPSDSIARQARVQAWLYGVVDFFVLLATTSFRILVLAGSNSQRSQLWMYSTIFQVAAFLFSVVLLIGIVLYSRMIRALRLAGEPGANYVGRGQYGGGMNSDVLIRSATASDDAIIAQFNARMALETEHLTLDDATVSEGVRAVLADGNKGKYFVAEICGRVIGQLLLTHEWSDWRNGDIWWIQSVYVDPEFRGRGIFGKMYRHVERAAREQGVRGLRLYVEKHNEAAKKVYERLGMTLTYYDVMEQML